MEISRFGNQRNLEGLLVLADYFLRPAKSVWILKDEDSIFSPSTYHVHQNLYRETFFHSGKLFLLIDCSLWAIINHFIFTFKLHIRKPGSLAVLWGKHCYQRVLESVNIESPKVHLCPFISKKEHICKSFLTSVERWEDEKGNNAHDCWICFKLVCLCVIIHSHSLSGKF